MSVDDRAARAAGRLRAAYGIVRELELLERWGKYGEVVIVGSVGIGVVVPPDIDLEIHSDEPRVADGFAVMAALAELPKARRITYLDARDRHEQGSTGSSSTSSPRMRRGRSTLGLRAVRRLSRAVRR